jgi:hypothetical protein
MVVFIVVACTFSVVTRDSVTGSAKQLDLRLIQRLLHVTRGVHVTMFLFFLLESSFLYVLLLIPRSLREIWGMNLPDLSEVSRIECHLLAFVVLASRRLMLL